MFKRVALGLLVVCLGWPSILMAGQIVVHPGTEEYRSLSLISFRGLPRLGEQADSVAAEARERHNYSLGLLTRLGLMTHANDCFTGMKGYEVRTGKCRDNLIEHSFQTDFWKGYIKYLACSLTPDAHLQSFCAAEGTYCGKVSVDQILVRDDKNKHVPFRRPDEFEKRDNAARLFEQRYASFEAYRKGLTMPSDVYFVSRVRIGKYQFDRGRFVFGYQLPAHSLASPNPRYTGPAGRSTVNKVGRAAQGRPLYSRSLPVTAFYVSAAGSESHHHQNRYQQMELPMAGDQARELVSGNTRELYAVVKLRLLPPQIGSHRPLEQEGRLNYRLADSRLELFRDSQLTRKVATLALAGATDQPRAATPQSPGGPRYQAPAGAHLLDYRTMSLLRLQQGEVPASVMERIAYSLPGAERSIWQNYQRRLDGVEMSRSNPNTSPEQLRRVEDMARLSAVSWQSSRGLNRDQRQALFDYLLGMGGGEGSVAPWPESLPSVEWGMNIATVFDRGHFSIARESQGVSADKSTQKEIRRFLKQAADSRSFDTLVLSYPLDDLRYDQKQQAMTFKIKQGPFYPLKSVQFFTDDGQVYKNRNEQLVSADARNRVIYPWRTSSSPVGGLTPNPVRSGCVRNEKTRSMDCVTGYSSFLTQQFYATFLALDKKLPKPGPVPMSPERGNRYLQYMKAPGWRVIIELDYEKMDLVTYDFKSHRESGSGEAQTLFGQVKSVSVVDQEGLVVWSSGAGEMADAEKLTRLTASPEQVSADFPDNLVFSPLLNDFLLARFYPDQLNPRMLEAMMSSRWTYEGRQDHPLGGRFFNRDGRRPGYGDIQGATREFRQWLISRAKALPKELVIEMPLQYGNDTMSVGGGCLKVHMPRDAQVRNSQGAQLQANQKVRECEHQNRQLERDFERCQKLRGDLATAERKLADARAGDCGKNERDEAAEAASGDGPCDIPDNLTFANMQAEMMRCMTETCGTPSAATDVQAYQECARAVSEQFQNEIRRQMGQAPRPKKTKKEDTCRTAEREIRTIERRLARNKCDTLTRAPELTDCAPLGVVAQPDFMRIERIDLSPMLRCHADASAYNRMSNASAGLLPNARPYTDTHYSFVLKVDELALPYDLPVAGQGRGQWTTVGTRITVAVKAADTSLNRSGQFGLAVDVRDVDFGE